MALRFPNSLPSSEGMYLLMPPRALGTHAEVDVTKGVAQFSASRCNIWSNSGYECYQDVSQHVHKYFGTSILCQAIGGTVVNKQYTL